MHTSKSNSTLRFSAARLFYSALSLAFSFQFEQTTLGSTAPGHAKPASPSVPPEEAFKRLVEGNHRWMSGHTKHPRQSIEVRKELATHQQTPFAIVVGCSDSRNSPELIFDQGNGDLFVVREAGNLADEGAIASIEYAIQHLGPKLVVVLGHTRCGAIAAAMQHTYEPHMAHLLEPIRDKIEKASHLPGDPATNASRANAFFVADSIRKTGNIVPDLIKKGQLRIESALYHLDTGEVEFIHSASATGRLGQ